MDRSTVAAVALVLIGATFAVAAPSDPQYSVSVSGPTEAPTDEPVVAYENLSEANQELFREAFDDDERLNEPPDVEQLYVEYEGETYEMSAAAHEGPVLSLLVPPIGGLFVVAGCLVAVYRHLSRS